MHMIEMLKKRREDGEEGFTLIELMVVVLIIAILIAIAIPTFLGAQDRARDRAAQSNLRNGITAAKTIATDFDGLFVSNATGPVEVIATDLKAVEGSLTFVDGNAAAAGEVGVVTPGTDGKVLILNAQSASGKFFCIAAQSNGTVTYGKSSTAITSVDILTECSLPKF